jgi:hypothetical protein
MDVREDPVKVSPELLEDARFAEKVRKAALAAAMRECYESVEGAMLYLIDAAQDVLIAKLKCALARIVYPKLSGDGWSVGRHGDSDVTEEVGDLLTEAEWKAIRDGLLKSHVEP